MKRLAIRGLLGLAVVMVVIQFLPIGRVDNPPVTQEALWPNAQARSIAVAACYDCHSNQVKLKWFDRIAPASWLVGKHVEEGRAKLNFSDWDRRQESDEVSQTVEDGSMPLPSYTWLHPEGRLSDAEKHTLIDALRQMGEGSDSRGGRAGTDG